MSAEKSDQSFSLEQQAELEKQRTFSDAELLKQGAEYEVDGRGGKKLRITQEQYQNLDVRGESESMDREAIYHSLCQKVEQNYLDYSSQHQEEKEKDYSKFVRGLFENIPIVGEDLEERPVIKKVEESNVYPLALWAYGGRSHESRSNFGPSLRKNLSMELGAEMAGMEFDFNKISFGSGEIEGTKLIILRQRQNYLGRNYPYTLVFDPGEKIRERAGYNDGVIIRNIVADPVWRAAAMDRDMLLHNGFEPLLMARLESSYVGVEHRDNPQFKALTSDEKIIGPRTMPTPPSPEQMAEIIDHMPEEERKKYTFIIRAPYYNVAMPLGIRHTWDNIWGPGGVAGT